MDVRKVPIGKDCDPIECDISRLTPEMVTRLAWHGLQQKLADARAGMNKKTEDYTAAKARGMSMKVWDNIVAGNWGRERGENTALGPLDARILRNAEATVRLAIRQAGLSVKDADSDKFDESKHVTPERFDEIVQDYIKEHRERITGEAEAELAKEAAAPKVDLSKLFTKP